MERRIDTLTSLRFFAALLVFLWHVQILKTLQLGYVGVGFFYILSGFILTFVYMKKLSNEESNRSAVKKFYIARIAKLYPLHILTFVVATPLFLIKADHVFPENTAHSVVSVGVLNLGLIQTWTGHNSAAFSFNAVAWSISVEMFFYAAFPILIFLITKYKKIFTVKRTIWIMAVLWLILTIVLSGQAAVVDDWRFYIFPLARLPDFVMGILLCVVFLQLEEGADLVVRNRKIKATWVEVSAILFLLLGIASSVFVPQSLRFSLWLMPFWLLFIMIFAQQKGRISRLLIWRPFVFLGTISFAFYMIHQLIIRYVVLIDLPPAVHGSVSFSLAIGLSVLLYAFYEEPARVRVKKLLESRSLS